MISKKTLKTNIKSLNIMEKTPGLEHIKIKGCRLPTGFDVLTS